MKSNIQNVKVNFVDLTHSRFFVNRFILALAFILTSNSLFAQEAKNFVDVIPPSPTAYEMTRFEAQQPSLYTGTANISIPLHTIDFDGWSLPLSLSYHAAGIKANQEATEVGLGWALNATAVISRTVQGTNDLMRNGDGTITGYPYDYLFEINENEPIQYLSNEWYALVSGMVDTQPDVFSYNFFGYSGSFVFRKKASANADLIIQKLSEDGSIITYDESNRTFTIKTPEGFLGEFTVKERTTSVASSAGAQMYAWKNENNWSDPLELQNRGNMDAISGWYLSKITSPRGNEIHFRYNTNIVGSSNPENYVSITQPTWGEGTSNMGYMTITRHKYLTEIEYNGHTKIEFIMESRADIEPNYLYTTGLYFPSSPNPLMRYTNMTVTSLLPNTTFSKDVQFHQSYFHGDKYYQADNFTFLRSRLDKVTIDDQEYKFIYNYGLYDIGLPHKSTREFDHFGYYNGDGTSFSSRVFEPFVIGHSSTTPWTLCYYQTRHPNLDYKIAGSLKKIIYPTGGSHEYEYENHDYYVPGNLIAKGAEAVDNTGAAGDVEGGGLRIASIVANDGNGTVKQTRYEYRANMANKSSGLLMTPLFYYIYFKGTPTSPGYKVRHMGASALIATSTAEGKQIGYSRVSEVQTSSYDSSVPLKEFQTVYEFVNEPTIVEPDIQTVHDQISREFSYRNGKNTFQYSYNNGPALLRQTEFYLYENHIDDVLGVKYNLFQLTSKGDQDMYIRTYAVPVVNVAYSKIETKNYHPNGDYITTTTNEYNDYLQLTAQETRMSGEGAANSRVTRQEYMRPKDFTNPTGVVLDLRNANIISPVIESRNYVDGVLLNASATKYNADLLPEEVYTFNPDLGTFTPTNGNTFTGGYEKTLTITNYDREGNVQEYVGRDGIVNSFIWGYSKEYPIVHGRGVSYTDLLSAYTAAGSTTSGNHSALRDYSTTADAQVTSYTYDPEVGIKTVTDVNANTSSYEYDPNRRLEKVRDLEGNLVQQMDYVFSSPSTRILQIVNNSIGFGNVAPGSSATEVITLKNTGNDVLTVTGISGISGVFSCNSCYEFNYNKEGEIGPGELFEIEVSFAPTASIPYSQTISIQTDKTGGSSSVQLSGTGEPPTRELVLNQDCYTFSSSFSTLYMRIDNTGNSPLTITHVESDDEHVDPQVSFTTDPVKGWPVMIPITVFPNSFTTIPVRLSYQLNNWDGQARVQITSDSDSGSPDYVNFISINNANGCPN